MKANELMVGDLLRVNRDGLCIKKDTAVQVMGIDSESKLKEKGLVGCAGCRPWDKNQFDGGIWLDYLDPIPLTPEILEKNGFIKQDTDTWAWEEKHISNTDIMYQVPRVYFTKEYRDERGLHSAGWIYVTSDHGQISVEGENVHELQHALRLCGIEKEIIL